MTQASSRLEERMWERSLDTMLQKMLKNGHQDNIDAALELAFSSKDSAYDALLETLEANSESCVIEHKGIAYDVLLIAAPILAWTRFSIPTGPIASDMMATLSAHLCAHVLAPGVRLGIAPMLYSLDQLPQAHKDIFALTHQLAQAALKGSTFIVSKKLEDTAPFLADPRYLVAAVVAPIGEPLFNWQNDFNPKGREEALMQWKKQALPNISRLLPGCGVELLLPEAFFIACQEADKKIRPASIIAAVNYIITHLSVEAKELQAIIGGFGDESTHGQIDEYRISFTLDQNPDVLYGVVWPIYGDEIEDVMMSELAHDQDIQLVLPTTDTPTPMEQILTLLRESGITHIKHHEGCFPPDVCDDCGTPYYLDMQGELVHPEMPEDAHPGASHLH